MSQTLAQLQKKMREIISRADKDFRETMMNQVLFGMQYQAKPRFVKLLPEDVEANIDFWGKSETEIALDMQKTLESLIRLHGIRRYATPEMKKVLAKKTKKGRKISLRVKV